mmetsp:Transcript_246/g.371  ORF Transcript_246/g.371 Transcript_246/m.371 type:complete len:675 (+) Transcript_246:235-2259(+)
MTDNNSKGKAASSSLRIIERWSPIVIHIFLMLVYLIPILTHPYQEHGGPTLDEIHITSLDNKDVQGQSTLYEVFTNDYWGRNMWNPSSHKSWRPLSVLSFRWLRHAIRGKDELFSHRFVNIITHTATADMVSLLAVLLFPSIVTPQQQIVLRIVTKLIFGLHPTHVEVTANAANRPHILAVLCSTASIDPSSSILIVMLFQLIGVLSAETFLFQMPATILTMTVIAFRRRQHQLQLQQQQKESSPTPLSQWSILGQSMIPLIPRYVCVILINIGYYVGRKVFDTLSIPDGLIRLAENPFYSMAGWQRVRNYLYVLSIHIAKSNNLDFIGFSHEYGFNCIPELTSWTDTRLLIPLGMFIVLLLITIYMMANVWKSLRQNSTSASTDDDTNKVALQNLEEEGLAPALLWLVHLSWLATLFPISGVVKVGTFVADRIVVASTVSFSIFIGRFVSGWILTTTTTTATTNDVDDHDTADEGNKQGKNEQQPPKQVKTRTTTTTRMHPVKTMIVMGALGIMWYRVHHRTLEWMDSLPLLQSSLKTCPESAKSNLEISKIYSGLYPEMLNLTKARSYIEKTEYIDPTYCDVHQQFAHVAIQEGKYLEFEQRLVKGIMCPFSMGGCTDMWNKYWKVVLQGNGNTANPEDYARYQGYLQTLNEAIENQQREDEEKKLSSSQSS